MSRGRKKTAALVLAGALALGIHGTGFGAESDFMGDWYLNYIEAGGISIAAHEAGIELSVSFREDGTADMTYYTAEEPEGLTQEGKWTLEGDDTIVLTDETEESVTFALDEDGNLSLVEQSEEEEYGSWVFGREKLEAEPFEPGDPVENAALEDYEGVWDVVYYVYDEETRLSVSSLGFLTSYVIEDGKGRRVTSVVDAEDTEVETALTLELQKDGTLLITDEYEGQYLLQLYSNGWIEEKTFGLEDEEELSDTAAFYQKHAEE